MKNTIVSILICGAVSSALAVADPLPCSGSLANINDLGGCTIGDKLFTNFTVSTVSTAGSAILTLSNILVTSTPPGTYGLIFRTLDGFSAFSGLLDTVVGYTVQTTSGAALIEDLGASVGHPLAVNLLGEPPDATASVHEVACLGLGVSITGTPGHFGCSNPNAQVTLGATPGHPGHVTFTPVSGLSVAKELELTAGVGTLATVESFTNTVSQVPEPASAALLGSGLVGVLLFRRRGVDGNS